MRARHVGAQLLEVGHDPVHVRRRERRAAAGHVLVDRGAGQLDAAVVEVEQPALDRHRAQADPAAVDLLHRAAVAQHDARRVQLRVLGLPQLGGWDGHRDPHAAPLAALARQRNVRRVTRPEGERSCTRASGPAPRTPLRCSTPSTSSFARQPVAGPLQVTSDIVPRSPRWARPAGIRWTGRTIPPQFHQPSGRRGSLRLSTTTTRRFSRPGRSPRASNVNGRVGVDVLAEPVPVEEHRGRPPDALELDQPAKAARRGGTLEVEPVAAHLPAVLGRHGLGVEDARDRHRAPAGGRLGRRAAGSRLAAGRHVLGLALERRGRLVRRRGGRLVAHLPARRQRLGARRRRRGCSGERDQ